MGGIPSLYTAQRPAQLADVASVSFLPPSLPPFQAFIIVSDLCGALDQTQAPVQNSAIELHPWLQEDEAL